LRGGNRRQITTGLYADSPRISQFLQLSYCGRPRVTGRKHWRPAPISRRGPSGPRLRRMDSATGTVTRPVKSGKSPR